MGRANHVPEATSAELFGPETGRSLKQQIKLKKSGDQDHWVLIRREDETGIFKVAEAKQKRQEAEGGLRSSWLRRWCKTLQRSQEAWTFR